MERLLWRLRRKQPAALEQIMARYGGYVYTVVKNQATGLLPHVCATAVAGVIYAL